ncbi:MAG: DUF1178 family protein [Deltaproteobacteria bacterium]|jgi:hypothetical protein|nr:DUF1178 family protein [Deltaproteobacteria bacterium]
MVVFDLTCLNGHYFEGWFDSLADLEDQIASNLLVCPVCNDSNIVRRPSTFGLVKSRGESPAAKDVDPEVLRMAQMLGQLKAITQTLEKEFMDVGANFSDEALKMHYGVMPKRNIRGLSTEAQEEMLKKEGVDFFKVPMLSRKSQAS